MDHDPHEPPEPKTAAERRAEAKLGLLAHLIAYTTTMAILLVVNVMTSSYPWVIWPAIGWGIGVTWHVLGVYVLQPDSPFYRRAVDRELRRGV